MEAPKVCVVLLDLEEYVVVPYRYFRHPVRHLEQKGCPVPVFVYYKVTRPATSSLSVFGVIIQEYIAHC
jgi:hypothetical protein